MVRQYPTNDLYNQQSQEALGTGASENICIVFSDRFLHYLHDLFTSDDFLLAYFEEDLEACETFLRFLLKDKETFKDVFFRMCRPTGALCEYKWARGRMDYAKFRIRMTKYLKHIGVEL